MPCIMYCLQNRPRDIRWWRFSVKCDNISAGRHHTRSRVPHKVARDWRSAHQPHQPDTAIGRWAGLLTLRPPVCKQNGVMRAGEIQGTSLVFRSAPQTWFLPAPTSTIRIGAATRGASTHHCPAMQSELESSAAGEQCEWPLTNPSLFNVRPGFVLMAPGLPPCALPFGLAGRGPSKTRPSSRIMR